jgi:competence protein ComEC
MNYPFYRLLLFLLLGILSAFYFDLEWEVAAIGMAICAVIACLFKWTKIPIALAKPIFGIAVLIFFFLLGVFSFEMKSELVTDHFTKQNVIGENAIISIELSDRLTPNKFNTRYYANVTAVNDEKSSGRILVLFKRADSVNYELGDRLLIYDDINNASDARNPGDFNYKEYLKTIDVYGQVYVDRSSVINVSQGNSTTSIFQDIKKSILERLATSGLETAPRAMIEALILGQRQNVNPEITKSFRDAGVIHILALSGLHVGIILLILRFLTKGLLNIKYGRWIQSIFIIVFLWCFAILTGLSPSIMRAVTMFSFVAIGMNIKRKASTFHSLTLSAFVLLLIDARLLFQVGFQLSYMAVFTIVLLQPILKSLWPWHNKVKNFFWNIFTVTLAAQIGVAPLSIFYFHQLPGLFLVANMMLLPLLPFIIGGALLLIALLFTGIPFTWLVNLLNVTLQFLIEKVDLISSYDQFIFKDIYIELYELILIYVILFTCAYFVKPLLTRSKRERYLFYRTNWFFHVAIGTTILLFGIKSFNLANPQSAQVFILHQASGSAISYSNTKEVILWTDLIRMDSTRRKNSLNRLINIEPHRSKHIELNPLKNILIFNELTILRIDSTGIWNDAIKNPIICLSGSPKINLARIVSELQPKAIISDGSNYRSTAERWKKTCEELDVPFYNTYENGAIDLLDL